jgi:uncharacterized protein
LAHTIRRALVAAIFSLGVHGHAAASALEDGQKAVLRGDYPTALAQLVPLANAGNAPAQYELGRMYEAGEGVTKDYGQAATWYRKAGLQGDNRAQLLLALMYARGQGVPQDNTQGLYWLGKASQGADSAKQQSMHMLYYQTLGTFDHGRQRSVGELAALALPALQRMADEGNPQVRCALLQLYETGQAVPRKQDDLASWHRKCAELGYEGAARSPPPGLTLPPPR